ncbi:DUF4199 domain-containing protein, partial [Aquimarina sp. D1M17]|uniref:DUF4199 domain-containing protein n=1 Tax=Aquimarina acroporae TaxID=2937283 RepID=UPI0020BDB962
PNKTSIYKHILKYGLIYGCICFLHRVMTYLIFNSVTTPKKWIIEGIIIDLFLYIGGVTYTIYLFKKNNNRYLKFLDAVKIGFSMGVFMFIFNEIWYSFYTSIINPDYLGNILERNREAKMFNNLELSSKELDQITLSARSKFDFKMKLSHLVINIIINSLIASIVGAIMHKKKKL